MENQSVEIKSEGLRNFIGEIPPKYVRMGNILIFLLLFSFFVASLLIQYPHNVYVKGQIVEKQNKTGLYTIKFQVPYGYLALFDGPHDVEVQFEGNPSDVYSYKITSTDSTPISVNNENYFSAYANAQIDHQYPGVKCTGTVLIENKTIWQLILGK